MDKRLLLKSFGTVAGMTSLPVVGFGWLKTTESSSLYAQAQEAAPHFLTRPGEAAKLYSMSNEASILGEKFSYMALIVLAVALVAIFGQRFFTESNNEPEPQGSPA